MAKTKKTEQVEESFDADEEDIGESDKTDADEKISKLWRKYKQNETSENLDNLKEFIAPFDGDTILKIINKRVAASKPAVDLFLAVLKSGNNRMSTDDSDHKNSVIRRKLFKHFIYLCRQGKLHDNKDPANCANALNVEVEELEEESLKETIILIHRTIASVSGQTAPEFLDIYPTLLASINKIQQTLENETGPSLKSRFIKKLCEEDWPDSLSAKIIDTIREAPLTSKDLENIFKKSLATLDLTQPDSTSFIYQLLVLSNKGHKQLLLRGITNHFAKLDHDYTETRQNESEAQTQSASVQTIDRVLIKVHGNTLHHFDMAFKQDPDLASQFIKLFKAEELQNTAFAIAILLSIARTQRFQANVYKVLKDAVIKYYKDTLTNSRNSGWLLDFKEQIPAPKPVAVAIVATVTLSQTSGWEYIGTSLVDLAFTLMDSNPAGVSADSACRVIDLGISIAVECFKGNAPARDHVIEQIFSRIMTKSEYVAQYITLLGRILQNSSPDILDNYADKVKEIFDYIGYLTPLVVQNVLAIIQPIIQRNPNLQEYIILVLRKSIFSRELESRLNAVSGFLFILKNNSDPKPATNMNPKALESLNKRLMNTQFEIIGFLRRCLTQQAEIRGCLYDGFSEIYKTTKNVMIRDTILEILYEQFLLYYSTDDNQPPLKLDLCIEKSTVSAAVVTVADPLPALLTSLAKCLHDDESETPSQQTTGTQSMIIEELKKAFLDMSNRFSNTKVILDFELDSTSDYSTTTSQGRFNWAASEMVIGVYKVLVDHWIYSIGDQFDMESWKWVAKMFEGMRNIEEARRKGQKAGEKKVTESKTTKGRSKTVTSGTTGDTSEQYDLYHQQLDPSNLFSVIKLFDDKGNEQSKSFELAEEMNHADKFQTFILNLVKSMLVQANKLVLQNPHSLEAKLKERYKTKLNKFCRNIGSSLFSLFHRKGGNSSKAGIIIECYELAIQYLLNSKSGGQSGLYQIMKEIVAPDESRESPFKTTYNAIIRQFATLEEAIDGGRDKEAGVLSGLQKELIEDCIFTSGFNSSLEEKKQAIQGFQEELDKLCKKQIKITGLVKNILTTHLDLIAYEGQLEEISTFCKELKDSDEEEGAYAIINKDTKSTIMTCIDNMLINFIQEVSVVLKTIKSLKSRQSIKAKDDEEDEEDEEDDEKVEFDEKRLLATVYDRMQQLGKVVEIIIQSQIAVEMMESVLRIVVDLYTVVGTAAKQAASGKKKNKDPPPRSFQALVEFFGGLTQKVYEYLLRVSESEKEKKEKQSKVRIKKEGTLWSKLVFAIENFEASIITLQEATKTNMMRYFKKSALRDFQILLENITNTDNAEEDQDEKPKKGVKRKKPETKGKTKTKAETTTTTTTTKKKPTTKTSAATSKAAKPTLKKPAKKKLKTGS